MIEHDLLIGRQPDRWWGLVKGHNIALGGQQHVAVHAPTGTGKTADFCLPNAFTWPGSLVVLDVKGEIFEKTAGHRATMGQDIYVFEPAGRTGRSHRWDPLSAISRDTEERFPQILQHANLLFPEMDTVGTGANTNKFWDDKGRQTIAAVTCLMTESPEMRVSMNSIASIFMRSDGHEWLAEQIELRRKTQRPYSKIVVDGCSDFVGGNERTRDDIRSTVSTRLQTWFYDPKIVAATSASDFDMRDLRRRPMTVYLIVAPGDIPRLRPIIRLFFDQAIALNTLTTPEQDLSLKVPTLFMLDEFARIGRSDSLAHAAQYVRAYGIRMAYIFQDAHQLHSIYGTEQARDLLNNVVEIVFGVTDVKAAQELENRLGDDTVMFTTRNRPRYMAWLNWSKHGESDHPHRRPLMLDHEILQMPPDEQLILARGMAMRTKRIRWFHNPEFLARVRPPPEIPVLKTSIEYDDGATRVRPSPTGNTTAVATT